MQSLRNFFARKRSAAADVELTEARRTIEQLRADLARERGAGAQLAADLSDARFAATMSQLAVPVAQALTQIHLHEAGLVEVNARDALVVLKRVTLVLSEAGLVAAERIGTTVGYDPVAHEILGSNEAVPNGARVIVKQPGMRFRSRLLRKSIVARAEPS